MHIKVTTDPMTMNEVNNPESRPCYYQGDGINGLEIYFENDDNMQSFLEWEQEDDHKITLMGNDSDDYIAEG